MTEELFREDAFARQCDATVVGLAGDGVRLDRTVFYCTGGGQPGDRGRLVLEDDSTLEVIDLETWSAAGAVVASGFTPHEVVATDDGRLAYLPVYSDAPVGLCSTDTVTYKRV